MKADLLKIGDKFTTQDDTIKIVKSKDKMFVICRYVPDNGYTVYVPRNAEANKLPICETFKSNPDWKRNMLK